MSSNNVDYTAIPMITHADPPTEKGEKVSLLWNLNALNEHVPFQLLDEDKFECVVQLGDDDNVVSSESNSKIRIRFGLVKTQYPQSTGDVILNYLSLNATALNTGGREGLEFLVSLDFVNTHLTVWMSPLKDAVVHLKARGERRRKVIHNLLLDYSHYKCRMNEHYHQECFETFHTGTYNILYGITVTLLIKAGNEQGIQKLPSHVPCPSFTRSLQAMYESEQSYSDIKLEAKNGLVLDAHKFILAARSPVLRDMLSKAPRDEQGHELKLLKIDNINGEPLRSILHWMYTNNLDKSAVMSDVMEGAKVLGLTGLLSLIDNKLINICHPENMMQLFIAAREHQMKTAMEDIRQYIKE